MSRVEDDSHKAKMMKRKAVQDAEVAAKPILEKGLLIVHTGPGKGKSTAAFGLVLRALGRGLRVGVVQFIKGAWSTGERTAIERFGAQAEWRGLHLGACLLNPGELGFEPLKPVGEPDAANSRIRFDVRVEALRPSFVAPFPRWRSSAGCECGKGRGPPLGELQDIVGEADEAPLVGDLLDAAQEKLTEAARLLDLSEHRLGQLLS